MSGTPEEFAVAVWTACDDLFCTPAEAKQAIEKYSKEYALAQPDSQQSKEPA
jgi:hypothetical protein